MSQEINLVNPALRPKRDWLAFRFVSVATLVALLLVGGAVVAVRMHLAAGVQAQAAVGAQLAGIRQELQTVQLAFAARQNDPALAREAERLVVAIEQRRGVLGVARGLAAEAGGVAEIMRGFSRQRLDGVWLTAFNVGPGGFDLEGRLLDPGLLPVYIRRLNAEPAFRGRHFAALDMHGVEPAPPPAGAVSSPPAAVPTLSGPLRYTAFSLQATLPATAPKPGRLE